MKATGPIPQAVLSQQLSERIGGRRVRTAVFATFTFDPGFFELHILPTLFDQSFSQVDKVRRIQLEDALRSVDHTAVYYDRGALAQDGEPAHLEYRRLDVRRTTGCFHPKVIFLLLDEFPEEPEAEPTRQSLLVAILSANLTRGGWWENVECAHFEEIKDIVVDDSRCSFRPDLLSLIKRIRDSAVPEDDHSALDVVHNFLLKRTKKSRFVNGSSGGRYYTRVFLGQNQQTFSKWLSELRLTPNQWNLEIVSPFFDPTGSGPLKDLVAAVRPRETRVYLPSELDGSVQVTEKTYEGVMGLGCFWGKLPGEIVQRGRDHDAERLPPRRVHAKVYRLWSKDEGEILIVGSVNLTRSAQSHASAGNLEAAFLVDVTDEGFPRRWWLQRAEDEPAAFAGEPSTEEDGLDPAELDLCIRYDWGTGILEYRLMDSAGGSFEVCEPTGPTIFHVDKPRTDRWVKCRNEASEKAREVLLSSSFFLIKHAKGSWRVLVREENMGHRPSLLTQLTPEEILEYWALLTPEQRAAFMETHLWADSLYEGIQVVSKKALRVRNTLFDRFAGIYHAFGCLGNYVDEMLAEGREREAETRLFGAKYDSLPSLLEKTHEQMEKDPIICYVTFLCAKQLRDKLADAYPPFFRQRKKRTTRLDEHLARLGKIRSALPTAKIADAGAFLDWYEPAFLSEIESG